MPDLDLRPDEHRPVYDKPLMKRSTLIWGLLFFGAATVLGIDVAAERGGWWVLGPVIPAIAIGVFWVGLAPGFWFRNPPR